MASKLTYAEKLQHPNWQKKRLEILGRDFFECKMCLNKNETLSVHHRHYIPGREPWDYPGELLVTLCNTCHKKEEAAATNAQEVLNSLHFWGYFNTDILKVLNGLIESKIPKSTHAKPDVT
jgi:5-methylcytosine-specific restriction endonuclease McrA